MRVPFVSQYILLVSNFAIDTAEVCIACYFCIVLWQPFLSAALFRRVFRASWNFSLYTAGTDRNERISREENSVKFKRIKLLFKSSFFKLSIAVNLFYY